MAVQFKYFFLIKKAKWRILYLKFRRLSLVRLILMYFLHLGFLQPEANNFFSVLFVCLSVFFFFFVLFCFFKFILA